MQPHLSKKLAAYSSENLEITFSRTLKKNLYLFKFKNQNYLKLFLQDT